MAYPAPSGRELAIEALLDREPHGDAYRVSRVLEEVVPMALQNRPLRVTPAALVEEAFVLQKYLDHKPKSPLTRRAVEKDVETLLLDFHERSSSSSTHPHTPLIRPAQWMEWLQTVWTAHDKKSSSAAPGLTVLQERLWRKDTAALLDHDDEESTPNDEPPIPTLETCLTHFLYLKRRDDEDGEICTAEQLAALWLVITLLLSHETADPVQCGHLLSALQFSPGDHDTMALDTAVLDYFGKAATICQERWLAQKPPVEEEARAATPEVAEGDTTVASPVIVTEHIASTEAAAEGPAVQEEETEDMAEVVDDEEEEEEEDIVPQQLAHDVVVVEPDSSESSSDSESSDSEESSSSESSSSEARPDVFASGRSEEDATDDAAARVLFGAAAEEDANADGVDAGDEDDYDTLRQALAISVNEESSSTPAVRVVVNQSNDDTEEEPIVETPVSDGADGTENFPDDDEMEEIGEAQVELPALPEPPERPDIPLPLFSVQESEPLDGSDAVWKAVCDPTNERHFAVLPRSYVLVHLVRYAESLLGSVEAEAEQEREEMDDYPRPTVSAGIGGFLSNLSSPWDEAMAKTLSILSVDRDSTDLIFQLTATTLVSLCDRRNEALQKLKQVLDKEQRAMRGDMEPPDGHPVGDEKEEDDPATAFAMSHVEDEDVPLSIEVLENKGMRRKAAAAAHDAARLLRTVRKEKEDLKASLSMGSAAILSVLKFFRGFLYTVLCDWFSAQDTAVRDLRKLITPAVRGKLIRSLEDLTEPVVGIPEESPSTSELMGEILFCSSLYKEATLAWGEASPILYDEREVIDVYVTLLASSVAESLPEGSQMQFESIDILTTFPTAACYTRAHRLQVLSRRYQMDDVLVRLVGVPRPWFETEHTESKRASVYTEYSPSLSFPNKLLSSLRDALEGIKYGKDDVERFYEALCHRIHTKILLFDGLFTVAKAETNPLSPILTSSKKALDPSAIHVHASPGPRLLFDSTKCADSIAIISGPDQAAASGNGPSVNQRASKLWGNVLSTQYYSPKTGIHRWAVRLDKCERGHVFIGVATSQASVKTYVGGDKHGWGMIGTQALWHDRRKVRGDYGGTFRTGSIIIVTLDTDAGTLSFGSWKNGSSTSSTVADSLVHNILSPRNQSVDGGNFDDWGVAFEGLPLDSRLFPAVGLYQRDDKVTLLPVDSGTSPNGSIASLGGICFYPDLDEITEERAREDCQQVRNQNLSLISHATRFASETLDFEFRRLSKNPDCRSSALVLRSLLGCISVFPLSVPLLSTRCALSLLPTLTSCISKVGEETFLPEVSAKTEALSGDWIIRASSGSGVLEEYKVTFESMYDEAGALQGFKGRGVGTTGKSKNGRVLIWGTVTGASVNFVEEWTVEKSKGGNGQSGEVSGCVVSGCLSLCANRFEGTYKNVDFGSGGEIAGFRLEGENPSEVLTMWAKKKSTLLSCALGRLATTIACDSIRDFTRVNAGIPYNALVTQVEKKHALREVLGRRLISSASLSRDMDPIDRVKEILKSFFYPDSALEHTSFLDDALFGCKKLEEVDVRSSADLLAEVESIDGAIAPSAGGFGSLRAMCATEYDTARHHIVAAMLHQAGIKTPKSVNPDQKPLESHVLVWRKSLQIIEDGVRCALAQNPKMKREASKEQCNLLRSMSEFILRLSPSEAFATLDDCVDEIQVLYSAIKSTYDIEIIEAVLTQRAVKSTLSLVGILGIERALSKCRGVAMETFEGLVAVIPQIFGSLKSREVLLLEHQSALSFRDGLTTLPLGSSLCLRKHLAASMKSTLVLVLAQSSDRLSRSDPECSSVKSLILSSLAAFASFPNADDSDLTEDVLSHISAVITRYRPTALGEQVSAHDPSVISGIEKAVDRDLSRAIVRSATAVAHAAIFSVASNNGLKERSKTVEVSSSWLLSELKLVVEFLESSFESELSTTVSDCSTIEWKRWIECTSAMGKRQEKSSPEYASPGLQFFWEHGTLHTVSPPRPLTKDSTVDAPVSTDMMELIRWKLGSGFRNRHLAHWLHILCAVMRSSHFMDVICTNTAWLTFLLASIGLDCSFEGSSFVGVTLRPRNKGILPARHRARMISLSFHFLSRTKPNELVAQGLFSLAGSSCISMGIDEEERVSRETVSLLRKLHSPLHPDWRQLINELLSDLVSSKSLLKRAGVRAMFGGCLSNVGPLCRVLLKPVAATAIAKEGNSSSQSKSQGSMAASQAPVGADHIVSGLMRHTAEGGIVSSVDPKTGICEVILIPRKNVGEESEDDELTGKGQRRNLTVRALRTQSTDLVAAEEEALVIDSSVPTLPLLNAMLPNCVESLHSAASLKPSGMKKKDVETTYTSEAVDGHVSQNNVFEDASQTGELSTDNALVPEISDTLFRAESSSDDSSEPDNDKHKENLSPNDSTAMQSVQQGIGGLTMDLMALKSCVLILSDTRSLESFLDVEGSSSTLSRLLALAWPEQKEGSPLSKLISSARTSPIASLSWHEAKYSVLCTCLREVDCRRRSVRLVGPELWSKRATEISETAESAGAANKSASSVQDTPATLRNQSNVRTPAPAQAMATSQSTRNSAQSSVGSNSDDDEEGQEQAAESDDAQHLREAAIVQMAELGIPRPYAELALRRVGGTNIEAAVHFCLEHEADIERMLADEMSRQSSTRDGGSGRDGADNSHLLNQLLEMGFKRRWCMEALANTGNNVDEALTWILTNTEMLEAMYNSDEEGDGDNADVDDDESEEEEDTDDGDSPQSEIEEQAKEDTSEVKNWDLQVTPLRLISGKATIDSKTLDVTGQPNGGFASVGMKGVLLQSGKFYYEVVLGTAGCIQVGFADSSFAAHCNAERGDGCGDSSSSFSFDGWRRLRWHSTATEWGCKWQVGDVIGCLVDIDRRQISFTLNGQGEEIGMGVAFSDFDYCGGLYPVVSFNRKENVRLILGGSGEPFKYPPPPGYRGVGEALPERIRERLGLLQRERELLESTNIEDAKGFLCDYSDEDHGHELFSWSHRYYGADASVHLGSVQSRQSGLGRSSKSDNPPSSFVGQRLKRLWSAAWAKSTDQKTSLDGDGLSSLVEKGYEEAQKEFAYDAFNESIFLGLNLARKMLLHIIIATRSFDPKRIFGTSDHADMVRLVKILQVCVGAQNWTGEASAMAMAAESLGLGVQVQMQIVGKGDPSEFSLNRAGFTQVLSSIMYFTIGGKVQDTSGWLLAAAEGSLASDASASLTFLKDALQDAVVASEALRNALLAAIRRGIRFLALIDDTEGKVLADDEGTAENEDQQDNDDRDGLDVSTDAKLVSFFTGLLLNESVLAAVDSSSLSKELFSAWSVGLLSASLPWRMICAQTCASILSEQPSVFAPALTESRTLSRYFGRLPSAVARRIWAERAASPVCSRYVQSMIELVAAVRRSEAISDSLPEDFHRFWKNIDVEASCPRPLTPSICPSTESLHPLDTNGIMVGNEEVWTGWLDYKEVDWKKPARSTVRTLMDGGDGPPMLRVGCLVMRGPDWEKTEENSNVDGYELYESEKTARTKAIRSVSTAADESASKESASVIDPALQTDGGKKKRKKPPHPKLPIGTVVSVEPWNGVPALGRRVRWALTGNEGIYRFGGDGGRFDIMHVETNQKRTRVTKKYPFPETAEQCASRKGFGAAKSFAVILRLPMSRLTNSVCRGILELPDFGAGLDVSCEFHENKSITITENSVLFGQRDAGWEARFGQPSYVSGTRYTLETRDKNKDKDDVEVSHRDTLIEELIGSTSLDVKDLKNPADGSKICCESSLRLRRFKPFVDVHLQKVSSCPPPLAFDSNFHARNLSISKDQRTVVCSASDGRGCAFASAGFTKGVHYWEVTLGQVSESGSIFIGCAEKPTENPPRLNRWLGWGFVNFRATYAGGSERVYGVHAHTGDVIGVLLDCDAGRLSFFYDGLKYGEHIISDLGCAYENLAPFGFSTEGCGTGGHGQAAPNGFLRSSAQGFVKPKTLYPVIGLKNHGDRVTLSPMWSTTYGMDASSTLRNVLAVEQVLHEYGSQNRVPSWFVKESFHEYQNWRRSNTTQIISRASRPYRIELDTSPLGCARACAVLGMDCVLLPGDRIRLKRSFGRPLELAEDAVILGQSQLRLYYRIIAQKNEGQSLSEGACLPHYLHEFDVVDGIEFLSEPKGKNVKLPKLDRFRCCSEGGLKVIFSGGAIIRSDLEISDMSQNLGSIPHETVINSQDILDRRMNSCGILRYKVRHEGIEGYISAHIQGLDEDAIVEEIQSDSTSPGFSTPDSVASKWYNEWVNTGKHDLVTNSLPSITLEEFTDELASLESTHDKMQLSILDSVLAEMMSVISDYSESGDALECSFHEVWESLLFVRRMSGHHQDDGDEGFSGDDGIPLAMKHAVATLFSKRNVSKDLPPITTLLARVSFIRSLNLRARYALPWLTVRPSQEGSSVLGGLRGMGCCVDKAGRSWQLERHDADGRTTKEWIRPLSMGQKLRCLRSLIFSNIKREFLGEVTLATTTPTPLSHDEYELPREIRTVRINRMRAARALQSTERSVKRKFSVFSQLQSETRNLGGAALRRGYVAKGHGGQKRAFRVKLVGEGVNDYSGPYREVFADAFAEILKTDAQGAGVLGVLDATPNRASEIGEGRDLYMFSLNGQQLDRLCKDFTFLTESTSSEEMAIRDHFASLISPRNEASREVEEALVFLGRLAGTAYRHGIPVDLPLPLQSVWKALAEELPGTKTERLKELDILAAKSQSSQSSTGLLWWQQRMLNAFVDGLGNVIPVELLPLLTAEELRDTLCGSPEVNVDLLQSVVEYEGYNEDDAVIGYFWETLREATNAERRSFLQYVWARSRLPLRAADFESPFKILKDSANTGERADQALPSASTCFFSLTLPEYSSASVLKEKLMYAINNVTTMETDFQTNSAEIAEGYRQF